MQSPQPNIVLITVESTAVGHCSLYGYKRDTTPFLRKLADECMVFDQAYAVSSWTRPSIASIFTGLYPSQHGALQIEHRLAPKLLTAAEILQAEGYSTAAFCTCPIIAEEQFNYSQGFDSYVHVQSRHFDAFLPLLSVWLAERPQEPFFLYMHVFDPHCPYVAPGGFRDMYAGGYSGPLSEVDYLAYDNMRKVGVLSAEEAEYVKARYDGELAYMDHTMKQFVQLMKAHGLWDGTLFVLTADHGEAMDQHGKWGHRHDLYPEQLHVPLMVRLPGAEHGGKRMGGLASGVDILPTILNAVDVEVPQAVEGVDLLADVESGRTGRRYCYGELLARRGQRQKKTHSWAFLDEDYYFLVLDPPDEAPRQLLFDRRSDPQAEHDIAAKRPDVVQRYSEQMARTQESLERAAASEQTDVEEETLRALRDLGYM